METCDRVTGDPPAARFAVAGGVSGDAGRAMARVRDHDSRLHAFVSIFDAPPLASAHGPLAGLPYAAKDLFDLAGRAPTLGFASAPGPTPARNAAVIDQLAAQGAVLIGCTAMSELAYEPSGASAERLRPQNPWSAARICGGSSSGSAVAVAAGLVPLALGSDTAGSLRIPAHCCGVSAWKPTPGIVSSEGAMPLAPSLDAIGFLARDAALLRAVAGVFPAAAARSAAISRVAIDHDLLADCDPAIVQAVAQAEVMLRDDGIAVEATELRSLIKACNEPVLTLLQAEAAQIHAALLASGRLDTMLATRLGKGAALVSQIGAARAMLARLAADALDRAFGGADAVLLPVLRRATPRVAQCEPGFAEFSPRTLYELSALTRWVNGLGLPAVALPCGVDDGALPIAAQLVGRPHADLALLDLATALQARSTWHRLVPSGGSAGNSVS